jgi:murein DD-endopeptidase MepM/ murein hydrolase activator NlpD
LPGRAIGASALATCLVLPLVVSAQAADAAEETTTTAVQATTTTYLSDTTTTQNPNTTTTLPTTTTSTSTTTTTTTTVQTTTSTTTPGQTSEPPSIIEPTTPDPSPESVDFRVGTLPAPQIVFPVIGSASYRDTFGADREGGRRRHAGIDIFAGKGQPIVAVADGVIEKIGEGSLAGQYVIVRHDDGWRSKYLHLDNDSPGTDDGSAIGYARGIDMGMRVVAGTVIGFLGDSGNAENTVPHLHFELRQPNGLPINPYRALRRAPEVEALSALLGTSIPLESMMVTTFNTQLVGYLDPDGFGFNADITFNDDFVFIGTWGSEESCPGTGIRVIDVTDPSRPVRVGSFATGAEFPGTAAQAVWVGEVNTPKFRGDIAVVGVRLCDPGGAGGEDGPFVGLALYDLRDPYAPVLISSTHSGELTHGVQHLDIIARDGRLLAAAAVPQSLLHHPDGIGDIRFYDLTDLTNVKEISDWDLRRDGPSLLVESLEARVGAEALAGQSVSWLDGQHVVAAHSAGGLVTLDVSDPTKPELDQSAAPYGTYELVFGRTDDNVGGFNAHGGVFLGGGLLVQDNLGLESQVDDEGMPAEWGQQLIYDLLDKAAPRLVATFGTENSQKGLDGEVGVDGFYSPHQTTPLGEHKEMVTWLSDGVRIVDLEDPSNPREIAFFVPEARSDPQGYWVAPDGSRELPLVWGAVSVGDLVYASDVNSGLWIFRVTRPKPFGGRWS